MLEEEQQEGNDQDQVNTKNWYNWFGSSKVIEDISPRTYWTDVRFPCVICDAVVSEPWVSGILKCPEIHYYCCYSCASRECNLSKDDDWTDKINEGEAFWL